MNMTERMIQEKPSSNEISLIKSVKRALTNEFESETYSLMAPMGAAV